jgi:hypothetical protein
VEKVVDLDQAVFDVGEGCVLQRCSNRACHGETIAFDDIAVPEESSMGPDVGLSSIGSAIRPSEMNLGQARIPQGTAPLRERACVAKDDRRPSLAHRCPAQQVVSAGEVETGIEVRQHVRTPPNSDPLS